MDSGKRLYKTGYGYGQNKGTWKTYDDGKTWEYVADEKKEQVSIGATTLIVEDDGVYCKTPDETVRVLDEPYKAYGFDNAFYLVKDDELFTSTDGKIFKEELTGKFENFDDKLGVYSGEDGVYIIKEKKYTSNRKIIVYGDEDD